MTDIKKVEDALKNNFQEGINDFYVSYVIFPDGLIISADIHADMSDYLAENGLINEYVWEEKGTDIFTEDYNCVRCAKAEKDENYVELPLKPLTSAQYQSLTEWLDDNTYLFSDVHITIDRYDLDWSDVSKIYSYDEYTVDEIIGKIKRYYAFGKLQESIEMTNEYDSEGNQLSKSQVDFFKNSKVRDSKGNLLVVYHGTKENFDTFKYNFFNQTGRNYGKAYYFTDNRNKALGYSVDIYKDKRIQDYDKKHKELLKKFLDDKSEENKQAFLDFDPGQKKLMKILNDEDYTKNTERVGYLMECYLNLVNPLIKDAKEKYDYEVYPDYFKEAEEGNYDGIIVHNVKDVPRGKHIPMTVYIAFKENQMKNIFNYEPSISNNINEVYPNKGESKKDFIARFMEVTKDEYPDIKQRYAVANSYWDRRDLKEAKDNESLLESKQDKENFYNWAKEAVEEGSPYLSDWERKGNLDYIVKLFDENRKNLEPPYNDYYFWIKSERKGSAWNLLNKMMGDIVDKKKAKQKEKEGARLVYSDNDWKVYAIDTYEASKKYGANTKWCITGTKRWRDGQNGEGYFNDYYSQGIRFYFFLNKDGEKYALAYNPKDSNYCEIFNSEDISIPYIPGAPKIDEIKVDYTEEGTTDLDRVASYITSKKLSDEDFMKIIEEYVTQSSGKDYKMYNKPEDIITELNRGDYYDKYYLAWLKTNEGKMTPEEFERETGEKFNPDYWGGDTSIINYFDLYMLDPKYYSKYEYYAINGIWGDYGVYLYDDRLEVVRNIYESPSFEDFPDIQTFLLELSSYYLELVVGGKVKDWENKLRDAKCSEEYIQEIKDRMKHIGTLKESLLSEATRSELINKSKKADNYSKNNQKKGKNRYERRLYSKIARSVRQYNRIDFDAFFKKDILTVGIEVNGETNNYIVSMRFEGALREIANEVKANNGVLEFKTIARALSRTFNMDNVKIACTCKDHQYRISYFAHKDNYGIDAELRPSLITNPNNTKVACKHVLLVLSNLDWMLKVASVVNNYIKYSQKNLQNNYATYIFPKIYGMPYKKAVQLSLFDDGLLPSDQELLTRIASKNLKDKDEKGKWVKGNSYRYQPTKPKGIQPNPKQQSLGDIEENEPKNGAKLSNGSVRSIKLPTEEES